jgi:DNA mismatch repair protein MSH4
VGDIYNLNRTLSHTHNLPLSLVYQENGGFVFALKKSELEDAGGELPKGFVNVTSQKGRWLFSSLELVSLFGRRVDQLLMVLHMPRKK